jgi:hypothetical protein
MTLLPNYRINGLTNENKSKNISGEIVSGHVESDCKMALAVGPRSSCGSELIQRAFCDHNAVRCDGFLCMIHMVFIISISCSVINCV